MKPFKFNIQAHIRQDGREEAKCKLEEVQNHGS